jgi:adenylate cyclase
MLDEFLGDGLIAIFGVLPDPSCGAESGARAALDMRRRIRQLNTDRLAPGQAALEFGVALHTGEVVLGEVGITQRSDFTAIGDTVNSAARLEGQCKELGLDIVISGQTASGLQRSELAWSTSPRWACAGDNNGYQSPHSSIGRKCGR